MLLIFWRGEQWDVKSKKDGRFTEKTGDWTGKNQKRGHRPRDMADMVTEATIMVTNSD